MNYKTGIWIDHKKAVIVCIKEKKVTTETIESGIEKRVRFSGGARSHKAPYGPQEIASETRRDEKYHRHLKNFYKKVTDNIHNAERIFIFGPGEAKIELKKHIEESSKDLAMQVRGMESADKMTDRQIAAKVKEFFGYRSTE